MDFVKKNMVLVVTLTLSLGVSAFLVYEAVVATREMNKSMAKVDELKTEIQKLNNQNIIPKQDNLDKIIRDKQLVVAKKRQLQTIFGNPYRNAVKRMASALGMSEEDLRGKWRTTFLEEANKGSTRALIFENFFNNFGRAKKEKAFAAFKNALKGTVEPLNNANINGCIMEALGVPRQMEPLVCKKFLSDMLHNLVAYMEDTGKKDGTPFLFGNGSGKDSKVKFLTFDKYEGETLPMPEQVPYIFKHLKLIEDLLFRIKAAGLSRLLAISRSNMIGSVPAENYLAFTYTIKVQGSLDSVRTLVNSLLEAYKDNEVYVIRSMTMEDVVDEGEAVFSQSAGKSSAGATTRSGDRGKSVDTGTPIERNVVLIGNSDEVTAKITFDYILFTGNNLVPIGGK